MKFCINELTKNVPRLGILDDIKKCPGFAISTPLAMLYTRGGSIPHITNEIFKIVCKDQHIIQVPLVSTYNFEEAMMEFNGDISEFVGMNQCVSYVTVQDPGDYTQSGHHFQSFIPLWTKQGKKLINAKSYMNLIESFKPDMYHFLSDGDTNIASSQKRTTKAANNTVSYFKECLTRHSKSEHLRHSFPIASIAGGYSLNSRKVCIEGCQSDEIRGYLIDGLHNNGPEVELQEFKEIEPVIKYTINNLPPEKLRIIQGCWNPVVVIELVKLGLDLFDTSYCHVLTERSGALTFSMDLQEDDRDFELNLRNAENEENFNPIVNGCVCLTCTKYSRSYIHHLISVQELLGSILLMIHNIHYYLKFFENIRRYIIDNTLDEFQNKITRQFNDYQRIVNNKN